MWLIEAIDYRLFLVGDVDRSLLDPFLADAEELLLLHPDDLVVHPENVELAFFLRAGVWTKTVVGICSVSP